MFGEGLTIREDVDVAEEKDEISYGLFYGMDTSLETLIARNKTVMDYIEKKRRELCKSS